ncbi:MAG TPA: tripartite tricarboxylate transporter TctB family protein [Thermomicrobiales bacterium]|jgi:putative tricarboxylic transport membrane protein|nr:tripartite tricarboxylate transporter TctB family protein [Thermomicrobiales bacterium]
MAREPLEPPALQEPQRIPTGWERWSELLVAAGFLLTGIIILIGTQDIRVTRAATVSPRIIPQIVGIAILLVGAWYVIDIIRHPHEISGGEDSEDVDIDAPTDWRTLIIIGIALTIFAFTVQPLGFALASALMFAITSYAMGSQRHVLNVLIGLVLGIIVFLIFDGWLGVRLPDGILADILP